MGTDRETLVEAVVRGYGTVAHTERASRSTGLYDPSVFEPLPYDPEGARSLLDEAGWRDRDGDGIRESEDGTPLAISIKYNQNTMRQQVAEIMQAQLAEIGVEVEPPRRGVHHAGRSSSPARERDFDGIVMGWNLSFDLDDTGLFHFGPRSISPTRSRAPRIQRWIRLMDADPSSPPTGRSLQASSGRNIQQLLIEEQPYTFAFFQERLTGINQRVLGVEMDARGEFQNIKDWYLDPESR